MYRDYLGDIHKRSCEVESGIGDARRSRARDLMRPWKPQRGKGAQTSTNDKSEVCDAEFGTRRSASLDPWECRVSFCWGPPRKRTVTAEQECEHWIRESEEGRRLETLVVRSNNVSATWRMTSLGSRQRTISCRSQDVGIQRLEIYKRSSSASILSKCHEYRGRLDT